MTGKIKTLSRLLTQRPNASLLLFMATIAAVVLANSPLAESYAKFLEYPIDIRFNDFLFFPLHGEPMSLIAFVNDALMAIFFFVVGMEIKQEMLVGELSSVRKALLPVIAACGGMIVPVLVYLAVCHEAPAAHGAAIPMATDIAFALAALGALGSRVPTSLKVFLTALAVVDDIGGIIVIAIFYSSHIAVTPLLISFGILALLYLGGRLLNIQNVLFYYIGGFIIWYMFIESGIHSTIAGVLVAFTVPARPIVKLDSFAEAMHEQLTLLDFSQVKHSRRASVLSPGQVHILQDIHDLASKTISPLQSIVEKLNPMVSYFILPLFAFVNAGVRFEGFDPSTLLSIPLAIFLGLFVGKAVGIFLFSYLAAKTRIVSISPDITKSSLFGVSILGGIGFTVSLFIANLSFVNVPDVGMALLNEAKLGIFAGSIVSGVVGYFYLKHQMPMKD